MIIINRPDRSTYPEEKTVLTSGATPDFICARRGRPPLAIECKWSAENFEPAALKAFALHYPRAECFVVTQDTDRTATRRYGDLKVSFVSLESLVNVLAPSVE